MKRYLLDTTPLTAYLRGISAARALIEPWIIRQDVATSILVCGEVTEYNRSLPDPARRQEELRQLLQEIDPSFQRTPSLSAMPTYAVSCAHRTDRASSVTSTP